jgi:hypothetical protein
MPALSHGGANRAEAINMPLVVRPKQTNPVTSGFSVWKSRTIAKIKLVGRADIEGSKCQSQTISYRFALKEKNTK